MNSKNVNLSVSTTDGKSNDWEITTITNIPIYRVNQIWCVKHTELYEYYQNQDGTELNPICSSGSSDHDQFPYFKGDVYLAVFSATSVKPKKSHNDEYEISLVFGDPVTDASQTFAITGIDLLVHTMNTRPLVLKNRTISIQRSNPAEWTCSITSEQFKSGLETVRSTYRFDTSHSKEFFMVDYLHTRNKECMIFGAPLELVAEEEDSELERQSDGDSTYNEEEKENTTTPKTLLKRPFSVVDKKNTNTVIERIFKKFKATDSRSSSTSKTTTSLAVTVAQLPTPIEEKQQLIDDLRLIDEEGDVKMNVISPVPLPEIKSFDETIESLPKQPKRKHKVPKDLAAINKQFEIDFKLSDTKVSSPKGHSRTVTFKDNNLEEIVRIKSFDAALEKACKRLYQRLEFTKQKAREEYARLEKKMIEDREGYEKKMIEYQIRFGKKIAEQSKQLDRNENALQFNLYVSATQHAYAVSELKRELYCALVGTHQGLAASSLYTPC